MTDVLRAVLDTNVIVAAHLSQSPRSPTDDDVFVACAIVGKATHLVTYDPHVRDLGHEYRSVQIVDALHYLYLVRGDKPPLPS